MKSRLLFFLLIFQNFGLSSVSMVYNFRIAQITKHFQFDNLEYDNKFTLIALVFDQYLNRRNCISTNYAGGFGTFIFNYKQFYLRADSAFSHINEKENKKLIFSGTETDDVLFSLGYNFVRNEKNLVTFTGLFGIPTHKSHALQHADFGFGQNSLGAQLDGSRLLSEKNIFMYGLRYVRFFKNEAFDSECNKYKYSIGNLADIFVAFKNIWGKHALEYGYTAKFGFGAKVYPSFDDIVKKTNYIRSNFYINYRYKTVFNNIVNKFLLYFSYGFDHSPQKFGCKFILTFWGSWNVSF